MRLSDEVRTPDGAIAHKGATLEYRHDGICWRLFAHEHRRTVFLLRCRTQTELIQAIQQLPVKE